MTDYKVADINLAEFGRKEIALAEAEMPALMRRRAAHLTLATAQSFRDQGLHVLCLLDSLTRYAEAHREIALAAGEPPALRAFPPSTAAAIAGLCEQAGTGHEGDAGGDVTAVFTVLVAGSDHEEPVADMVRGTLDGHVVMHARQLRQRSICKTVLASGTRSFSSMSLIW